VIREQDDVGSPLAQRRQMDGEDVQPVIEVSTEASLLHVASQIPIRRRHDPDVSPEHSVPSDPLELTLLQDAQQPDLNRRREVPDFVEEDRAAFGPLEPPRGAAAPRR
jgi:hypothetical protein